MKLQGVALGMKPEEVISVGKFWLWMTVFSTCLFVSCGETDRTSKEPTLQEPKAKAVPVHYEPDISRVKEIEEEYQEFDDLEEFSDSDFDESELERFKEDEIQPEEFQEIREPHPNDENGEMQAKLDTQNELPDPPTVDPPQEAVDSPAVEEQPARPTTSAPSQRASKAKSAFETAWKAHLEAIENPDEFEPDSEDEFVED